MGGALAGGDSGVVAVTTAIRGLGVIKRHNHRCPHVGGMTHLTLFAGHWMGGGFIGARADTVMTTSTTARLPRYCRMIKQNL